MNWYKSIKSIDFFKTKYILNLIMCLLMCAWMMSPYLKYHTGVLFLLISFVFWILTTDLTRTIKIAPINLIFIVIFFATFLPYFFSGNLQYGARSAKVILVNFPLFFFGIFVNHYYLYYKKDYYLLGMIALISLIVIGISSFQTLIGLISYPFASRQLAGGIASNEQLIKLYTGLGIGGYGFIYSITFTLIAIFYLFFNKDKRIKNGIKVFAFIISLIMIITIFKASYAISVMLLAISSISLLLSNNLKGLVVVIIICILTFVIIPKSYIGNTILNIASIVDNNHILYGKFIDLANYFLFSPESSQTLGRLNLYKDSLTTFISNPIFGLYNPFKIITNPNYTVGGHSGWLDFLAYYGLFSGIPLFLSLGLTVKHHLTFFKNCGYFKYILTVYIFVFIYGFINPILDIYEIGFAVFFLVPAIPFIPHVFKRSYKSKNGFQCSNFR